MSKWITNRLPKKHEQTIDGEVWMYDAGEYVIRHVNNIDIGIPWCKIDPPQPYVESDVKFVVMKSIYNTDTWTVFNSNRYFADGIPTREAAERIANIYNEVIS